MPNPLTELQRYGQSVWLDDIRRVAAGLAALRTAVVQALR